MNGNTSINIFAGSVFIIIAILFFCVLSIIGIWKLFNKSGVAGWKSLIPIYNSYLLYKIAGCPNIFLITIVFTIISSVAGKVYINDNESIIFALIAAISIIVAIRYKWKYSSNLSKSFGKSTGFALGLFFLPTIFKLILGFGKAEYNA